MMEVMNEQELRPGEENFEQDAEKAEAMANAEDKHRVAGQLAERAANLAANREDQADTNSGDRRGEDMSAHDEYMSFAKKHHEDAAKAGEEAGQNFDEQRSKDIAEARQELENLPDVNANDIERDEDGFAKPL
jgi:hypothetical protein